MKKIKNLIRVIKNARQKTNKKNIVILFDIFLCFLEYKASIEDYDAFEMFNMDNFERNTFLTKGKNEEYQKKYNTSKFKKYFVDTVSFHYHFDKYFHRDWIELRQGIKEFERFCEKHKNIIAINDRKQSLEKIDTENTNQKDLYQKLISKGIRVVEEEIEKQYTLQKIKVTTLLGKIIASYLEIGDYKKDGLIVPISIDSGKIENVAVDKQKNTYMKDPNTNQEFLKMEISNWNEIKMICESASLEIPSIGYVEWNLLVGKSKYYLINASSKPNHNRYQLPPHRNKNIGLIPMYKKIEERKIEIE